MTFYLANLSQLCASFEQGKQCNGKTLREAVQLPTGFTHTYSWECVVKLQMIYNPTEGSN